MAGDRIICHCKQVSYIDIRKAMINGARTVEEIKEMTGAATGCGRCVGEIEKILASVCGCKGVSLEAVVNAVKDGAVVFLPHVNYSKAKSSLRKVDGEFAIQQGLSAIKGVGEVAAKAILDERKANGPYRSLDDFLDRVEGRKVNKKVKELLIENGALEFKKNKYIERTKKYNSALYGRAMNK